MHIDRVFDTALAQASYLISCDDCGEALVVDPARDITPYLRLARERNVRITRIAETHMHADFVSGTRELAAATGAVPHLSAEGGADWQYRFATADGATLLHDGDAIAFGTVRITVMHTPGHTPEHLAFLVADSAHPEQPPAMFSGDFLFVGDVGRPDLLERAAGVAGNADTAARQLFQSLQRLRPLRDDVRVWPGHGAGSACGKSLGDAPSTTLGEQRQENWALRVAGVDEFVATVLEGQPAPPPYFARMKHVNRAGPPVLGARDALPHLPASALDQAMRDGMVIDVRSRNDYVAGHVRGTLNLPAGPAFAKWAGWLVPADRPVYLIAAAEQTADDTRRALASIGVDNVAGVFGSDVLAGARMTRTRVASIGIAPALVQGGTLIVDVREDNEWDVGHLDQAAHHPLGTLPSALRDANRHTPVAVYCQGGTRSGIAASLLETMGFEQVTDLSDGWSGMAK